MPPKYSGTRPGNRCAHPCGAAQSSRRCRAAWGWSNATSPLWHRRHANARKCTISPLSRPRAFRAIEGDPLEAFYTLAINTGMRRGELLALHWKDVHLDEGNAAVKYTLQDEKGGRFTFAPPKTDKSQRMVPLNQTAIRALRGHRKRQLEQRLTMGEAWQEHDLVFTTAIGGPMRGNHILQRHFVPLCRRLGLPRIRLHDLRHTAATLLLVQKIQTEVVARILGHSSPDIAAEIYMHVTSKMQQDAPESLDQLFG